MATTRKNNVQIKMRGEHCGWFNDGWEDKSYNALQNNANCFTEVNPYWYNLGTSDAPPGSFVADGSVYARWNVDTARVRELQSAGKLVLPTIGDARVGSQLGQVGQILSTIEQEERLLTSIVDVVVTNSYDGIDINFEDVKPAWKDAFSLFLIRLGKRLHSKGKLLSVTLQPSSDSGYEELMGYDLETFPSNIVDRVKIMLYDNNFDNPNGVHVPAPIAPLQWVRSVLHYMIVTRGLPARKVQAALHNYGYVWAMPTPSETRLVPGFKSYEEIKQMMVGLGSWNWDMVAREASVDFMHRETEDGPLVKHRAYVGNPDTFRERVRVAEEFNLLGVAVWVLGREHPRTYDVLRVPLETIELDSAATSTTAAGKEYTFTLTGKLSLHE